MADALDELHDALVAGLGWEIPPQDGMRAFEAHQLLAIRIHRAARLNRHASDGDGQAWVRYFVECFPFPRNGENEAVILWKDYRVGLVKDEAPLRGVVITHANDLAHWQPDANTGRLVLNLESLRDDFVTSAERFTQSLRRDNAKRDVVLRRWREKAWAVVPIRIGVSSTMPASGAPMPAPGTITPQPGTISWPSD